jgi:CHAT domain-containing protein/lipopolysaccharide biosynthesis regulator YciM
MRYLNAGLAAALLFMSPLTPLSLWVNVVQAQTLPDSKAETDRLEQEGRQLFRRGQVTEALQTYDRALKAREQRNDKAGIAAVLNRIGEVYVATYQYEAAIEVLTRSQALHRELNNKAGEAESLYLSGSAYYSIKQYPKAIERLQQALTIQKTIGDRAGQAITLTDLAIIYNDQHLGRKTTQTFQQALALQDAIQDPYYKSVALTRIAIFYVRQGKLDQAQSVNQQALKIAQELQAKGRESKFFVVQSLIYFNQSNYPQAIAQMKQAIAINQQVNNRWEQGQNLSSLSSFYMVQAENADGRGLSVQTKAAATQSIEVGQAALTIARELKQPRLEASVLDTLGYSFVLLRDNQKAIGLLLSSLKIARDLKDLDGEGSALSSLSVVYVLQGEWGKKIEANQRAVEIAREQGDPFIEVSNLISLSNNYSDQPQRSLEINQQALAAWQRINLDELSPLFKSLVQQTKYSVLNNLSRSYKALGNYQTAIDYVQQNVTTMQSFRRPDLEAQALLQLAFLYDNSAHDYPKSIDAAQKALTIAQHLKDSNLEATALNQLGSSYKSLSDYTAALKAAEHSLSIAKRLENPELEKESLFLLRNVYQAQGQFQNAIETGRQLLTLVRQKNLQLYEPLILNMLSQNYLSLGDTTKAQEIIQQAIAIARQRNDFGSESFGSMQLGQVYKQQGQYEQAIAIFQSGIVQARKNKGFADEVNAALLLVSIYESLGNYQKVVATIEPYLLQIRTRNNRPVEARALVLLGFSYNRLGENQKGKVLVEQGLAIARQLKNPSDESYALDRLSRIYSANNDYQKALELAQQSLKIAQTLKSPPLAVDPQFTIGDIYQNLGDYANSRDYYQQAQATYKQLNNRGGEGRALLNLAGVAFTQGDAPTTIEKSQQALTIFQDLKEPRLVAITQRTLSLGYGESGNEAKAMEATQAYLTFARTVQNPIWEKDALTLSGDLQRKFGKNQAAIVLYQQALAINTPNAGGNNWGIYAGLARTTAPQQPNTAIAFYKQSINGLQEIRRNIEGLPPQLQQSFLQATVDFDGVKTADIYRQLANLLLSQGRVLEAQQVLELLKVQELKDFDRATRAKIDNGKVELDPAEQVLVNKYGGFIAFGQKLRECLASKPPCTESERLIELQTAANKEYTEAVKSFETAIAIREREDRKSFLNPEDDLNREAQKIVEAQPNTALIYSLVTDDKLWLVLASKGETPRQFEVKVSQVELNSTVVKFRHLMEQCEQRSCDASDTAALNAVSQKLYGWLFPKPLQQELQGKKPEATIKHLVFAQDRITRYIPMSALFDGKQYLIENYTVSTIVSAKFTNTEQPNYDPKTATILAAGLSNAAPPDFSALSNVPLELAAIVQTKAAQLGIYPGLELLNQQFNLLSLKTNISAYTMLHIATHGAFVRDQADGSYILLGTGEKLPISQIKELKNLGKVQLVVLSACQTALADRGSDGIEISNVSYSFLGGGVKAVIASLWQVNDASTSVFMQQFYKNLATGKMTKAEALRQAQLSLLQDKLTVKNAMQQRATLIVKSSPQTQRSQASDFSHPYYWAPFILIGNSL